MKLRPTRDKWLYIVKEYTSAQTTPYRIHHFRNTRTTNGMLNFQNELYDRFGLFAYVRPPDIGVYIVEDGKARHICGDDLMEHGMIPLPEPGMFAVNRSHTEREQVYSPTPNEAAQLLQP